MEIKTLELELKLDKFEITDLKDLSRIMEMNLDASGRNKDWKKFIQWNIDHPEDLYWKILYGHHNYDSDDDSGARDGGASDLVMVGYIGYSDATRKPTTKAIALPGDLFLEIYLDPNYTGIGLGEKSFNESIRVMGLKGLKGRYTIFASTYISNVRASKFFVNTLKMNFIDYNKKFNTNLYSKVIN